MPADPAWEKQGVGAAGLPICFFYICLQQCYGPWKQVGCPDLFPFPMQAEVGFGCFKMDIIQFYGADLVKPCCRCV